MDTASSSEGPSVAMTAYEQARAEALSLYEAKRAAAMRGVQRFRARHLGGRLLPPDEAEVEAFLQAALPDVLDELQRRVADLCERFGWEPDAARWVLLTGGSDLLRKPVVPSYKQGRIELLVDPWVRPETVARVYRQLQREMAGRTSRPISLHQIEVFRFVLEQSEVRPPTSTDPYPRIVRPPWARLMEAWNSTHPEHERYTSDKLLARDFGRARRALQPLP
jgi:hypothetical protein